MHVTVGCNISSVNQRTFVEMLARIDELEVSVVTESTNYDSIEGVPQRNMYHIQPPWPDSVVTLNYIHPIYRSTARDVLSDIDPDLLLVLGASRHLFLGLFGNFSPTVYLTQGGGLSKGSGNIYWDDSVLKKIRYRLLYRPLYRRNLQFVDEVWGGPATLDALVELGLDSSKFDPFDWGQVDTEVFKPVSDPVIFADDRTVIGSFRRMRGKLLLPSYETFFDAVGLLSKRRDDFHIVIGGKYEDEETEITELVEQKIAEYGLEDVVTILSMVPKEEIPRYYSGLDVYVNFTHKGLATGIGTATKEAMACECALVAFDDPSPEYVISDGDNGLLVSHDDPADIADKLSMVCDQDDRRKQLGEAARGSVVDRFSESAIRQRFRENCLRFA